MAAGGWSDYSMFGYISSDLKELGNAIDSDKQIAAQNLINKIKTNIDYYKKARKTNILEEISKVDGQDNTLLTLAFGIDNLEVQKLVCDLYIDEIERARGEEKQAELTEQKQTTQEKKEEWKEAREAWREEKEARMDWMLAPNQSGQSVLSTVLDQYVEAKGNGGQGDALQYYNKILKAVDYNLSPLAYKDNALECLGALLNTRALSGELKSANMNDLIRNSIVEERVDILNTLKDNGLLKLRKEAGYDKIYENGVHEAVLHLVLESNNLEMLQLMADELKNSKASVTLESLSKINNFSGDFVKSLMEIDMGRVDGPRFIKIDQIGKEVDNQEEVQGDIPVVPIGPVNAVDSVEHFLHNTQDNHTKVSMLEHLFTWNSDTKEFKENIEKITQIAQKELANFYETKGTNKSFIH